MLYGIFIYLWPHFCMHNFFIHGCIPRYYIYILFIFVTLAFHCQQVCINNSTYIFIYNMTICYIHSHMKDAFNCQTFSNVEVCRIDQTTFDQYDQYTLSFLLIHSNVLPLPLQHCCDLHRFPR